MVLTVVISLAAKKLEKNYLSNRKKDPKLIPLSAHRKNFYLEFLRDSHWDRNLQIFLHFTLRNK